MEYYNHIHDITPCGLIPDTQNIEILMNKKIQKSFVLILPGVFPEAFSAGPNTAFRFASEIAKIGYNILTISLQYPTCTKDILYNHLVSSLGIDRDVAKHFQVADMTKKSPFAKEIWFVRPLPGLSRLPLTLREKQEHNIRYILSKIVNHAFGAGGQNMPV